jgi:phospholipid N-methyltransferase
MRDHLRFLTALLRSPAKVGAIAPSSAALAKRMVHGLDLTHHAVLELGPGTGPITKAIASIITHPRHYLGIDREPHFIKLLKARFPDMRFITGSAQDALDHLAATPDLPPIKAVISGLPFASLPPSVQDGVIACLDHLLARGAVFRTFQYVHAWPLPSAVRFRRQMTDRFGPPSVSRPVIANLPPAVVLSWPRNHAAAMPDSPPPAG